MFRPNRRRTISFVCAVFYFTSQVVLGSATETHFWNERRRSIASPGSPTPSAQFASLSSSPAAQAARRLSGGLPSLRAELPAVLKSGAPARSDIALARTLRAAIDAVPAAFASVQDVHDAGASADAPVVLVQDVHLNSEAQRNIALVLQQLIDRGQAGLVGVEGAFSPFDFRPFRRHSNKEITRRVMEDLLQKNILAAPSFVGVTSSVEPPAFIGVDDAAHYRANLEALYAARARSAALSRALADLKAPLSEAKRRVFSPAMRDFDGIRSAHQQGSVGIGAYLRRLVLFGAEPDLAVSQFLAAYAMESALDIPRVEAERREVIEKLAAALSEQELAALVARSIDYRAGRVGFGEYYREMKALCEAKGIHLRRTPHFDNYIRYVLLSDGINAARLFEEMEKLEADVTALLARTEEERTLAAVSDQIALVEKLADFSLTPSEWERYAARRMTLEDAARTVRRLLNEREIAAENAVSLDAFEAFYREADERSRAMVKALLGPKTDGPRVLVLGGFHSPQVADFLRREKRSFVIVTPKLTRVDASGSAYLSVFARDKAPLDRLFAGEKLFIYPEHLGLGADGQATRRTNRMVDQLLLLENRAHAAGGSARLTFRGGRGADRFSLIHDEAGEESGLRILHTTVRPLAVGTGHQLSLPAVLRNSWVLAAALSVATAAILALSGIAALSAGLFLGLIALFRIVLFISVVIHEAAHLLADGQSLEGLLAKTLHQENLFAAILRGTELQNAYVTPSDRNAAKAAVRWTAGAGILATAGLAALGGLGVAFLGELSPIFQAFSLIVLLANVALFPGLISDLRHVRAGALEPGGAHSIFDGLPRSIDRLIDESLANRPLRRDQVAEIEALAEEILSSAEGRSLQEGEALLPHIIDRIASRVAAQEPIPVVELVAAMQGHEGATLAAAIRSGGALLSGILRGIATAVAQSVGRAIQSLSDNQFTELKTRPVIEVLLNAIDTQERRNFAVGSTDRKKVDVQIRDGLVIIQDSGEGISIEDLTRLLNPGEGGNAVQSATTGRFGAGFLSVFSYLKNPEDRIVIRTRNESGANRYEFSRGAGGTLFMTQIALSPSEAARIGRGTEIEIRSAVIEKGPVVADARRTLRYKDDADITVRDLQDGSVFLLNSQAGIELIGSAGEQARPDVRLRVPAGAGRTSSGEKTRVLVLINGVYFDTISMETFDEPKEIVIDFHKDLLDYARDRSTARPTQATLSALEALVADMARRYADAPDDFVRLANILYPVMDRMQRDTPPAPPGSVSSDPCAALKAQVAGVLESRSMRGRLILGDSAGLREAIAPEVQAVIVHPDLLPFAKPPLPGDSQHPGYPAIVFVPLRPGPAARYAFLTRGGLLLVDPSLRPALEDPESADELLAALQAFSDVSAAAGDGKAPDSFVARDILDEPARGDSRPTNAAAGPGLTSKQVVNAFEERVKVTKSQAEFELYDRLSYALDTVLRSDDVVNAVSRGFWRTLARQFRFDGEGRPLMPRLPPAIVERFRGVSNYDFFRQLEAALAETPDIADREAIVVLAIYRQMKLESESTYSENTYRINDPILAKMYVTGRKAGSTHSLRSAFETVLESLGIKVKNSPFARFLSPFMSPTYFQVTFADLPDYLRNDDGWANLYLQLVFNYYLKSPFDLNDERARAEFFDILNETFRSLLSGLSRSDADRLKDEFRRLPDALKKEAGGIYARSIISDVSWITIGLDHIRGALAAHGTVGFRLASHLHRLFADTPAVQDAPGADAVSPIAGAPEVLVSELIQGVGRSQESAERFSGVGSPEDLSALAEEVRAQPEELKSRARSSIRRAYEQTTDPFAFLREIVTNAYEAMRRMTGATPTFQVNSWVDGEFLVVSMADNGAGMDLQDIVMKLLQPNASGWVSDWLHFGQGFFTLFRSGDEVRLRSTKNGVATTVVLTPVRERGAVVDLRMRVSQERTSAPNGTTIEWRTRTADPLLTGSQLWVRLKNYVGLFDPRRMRVMWNSSQANEGMVRLARLEKRRTGESISIYAAAGESAFNLNGLFMRRLSPDMLADIPEFFVKILQKNGFVIDLESPDAQPLEGRTDFVGRREKFRQLSDAFGIAGVMSAAKLFIREQFPARELLPYDFITGAARYKPAAGSVIAVDAERLAAGKAPVSWAPYMSGPDARRNSVHLLMSLPVFSVGGARYSCFDAIIEGLKDENFRNQLPPWLRDEIRRNLENEANSSLGLLMAALTSGLGISAPAEELDPSDPDAAVLSAWQQLVEEIVAAADEGGTPAAASYRHEFFLSVLYPAIAYTVMGKSNIAWNVVAIRPQLKALHAALAAARARSPDGTVSRAAWQALLYRLIETTTHEQAHIARGESEGQFTHDQDFHRKNAELLQRVLGRFRPGGPGLGLRRIVERAAVERDPGPELKLPARFNVPAEGGAHPLSLPQMMKNSWVLSAALSVVAVAILAFAGIAAVSLSIVVGTVFLFRILLFVSVVVHEGFHLWADGQLEGLGPSGVVSAALRTLHQDNLWMAILKGTDIESAFVTPSDKEAAASVVRWTAGAGILATVGLAALGALVFFLFPDAPAVARILAIGVMLTNVALFPALAADLQHVWSGRLGPAGVYAVADGGRTARMNAAAEELVRVMETASAGREAELIEFLNAELVRASDVASAERSTRYDRLIRDLNEFIDDPDFQALVQAALDRLPAERRAAMDPDLLLSVLIALGLRRAEAEIVSTLLEADSERVFVIDRAFHNSLRRDGGRDAYMMAAFIRAGAAQGRPITILVSGELRAYYEDIVLRLRANGARGKIEVRPMPESMISDGAIDVAALERVSGVSVDNMALIAPQRLELTASERNPDTREKLDLLRRNRIRFEDLVPVTDLGVRHLIERLRAVLVAA